jgi:lipopolysaccharide export system permease protein
LKDIIVYDHRNNDGNKKVTVADSGRMSTILDERYIKFELFNGYDYTEGSSSEREITGQKDRHAETLTRSKFYKTQVVFDLSSFQMTRTDKKWFETNRIMRNLDELDSDIDSINREVMQQRLNHFLYKPTFFSYYNKDSVTMPDDIRVYKEQRDSLARFRYMPPEHRKNLTTPEIKTPAQAPVDNPIVQSERIRPKNITEKKLKRPASKNFRTTPQPSPQPEVPVISSTKRDSIFQAKVDSLFKVSATRGIVQSATNMARQVKSQIQNSNSAIENFTKERIVFEIQWHKIIASSFMCIAMFLIGAPLGAIIKRGGLGVPFLISILFFIIYYLLNMQGEKLAKQGLLSPMVGIWAADFILLVIGLIFLRQARVDARLFDADAYRVFADRIRQWFTRRRFQAKPAS